MWKVLFRARDRFVLDQLLGELFADGSGTIVATSFVEWNGVAHVVATYTRR